MVADPFREPSVEHEILADVAVFEALLPDLACVFNDAPIELMHILEALVLEVGRGLFAANAARAIHDDVFLLLALEHVLHNFDFLPERVDLGRDGPHEMPHLTFVMVAHVNQNGVRLRCQFIERSGIEVHAAIRDIKRVIVEPVRHDFRPNLDGQLEKRLPFVDRGVEPNTV